MPARPLRRLVAVLVCVVAVLPARPASSSASLDRPGEHGSGPPGWRAAETNASDVEWSDVPRGHWARSAIDHVAGANRWMRDDRPDPDGRLPFDPDGIESRQLFARALVRAFAPDAPPDPAVSFVDLDPDDRFYRFASVSVSNDWIEPVDGAFRPTDPVTTRVVHRALVLAVGLGEIAAGADTIATRGGAPIPTPDGLGTLLVGMRLGLRYDHADDRLDVGPDDALARAEVAWSLYRAVTAPSWVRDALAPYASIELPNLSDRMRRVVAWGVRYVGYPYVWGGEWDATTLPGYCCGAQPVGGFDCSGITWWVMKKAGGGWDNAPPRDYAGWDLSERSSASMAGVGERIRWRDIRPGDLLFYDGDDDGTVDHVNTFIGSGWAIDAGGSGGGVTLARIVGNWYQDHFVRGRRIVGGRA